VNEGPKWTGGVTEAEVKQVPPHVREALEYEARRVIAARLRVWCEQRLQVVVREHSATRLDKVISAFAAVLLREVKKTVDEFVSEDSAARKVRRDKAYREKRKQQLEEIRARKRKASATTDL